ncbi:MAG: hypothetical protein AD742_01110 [Methylibium sp. NZG]|nr:MAG: hypothetical protein AD742_01110 [Methylibium sp. NZG]
MIVCVCRRVSDRDIESEVCAGCPSFDALQSELQVGTACGACTDCARQVFDAKCSARRGVAWQARGEQAGLASALGTVG